MKWVGEGGGLEKLAARIAADQSRQKDARIRAAVHRMLSWTRRSAPVRKLCRGEKRWVAARFSYDRATYRCTSCGRVSYFATPECYPLVGDHV